MPARHSPAIACQKKDAYLYTISQSIAGKGRRTEALKKTTNNLIAIGDLIIIKHAIISIKPIKKSTPK
jgi:hypothetical protein